MPVDDCDDGSKNVVYLSASSRLCNHSIHTTTSYLVGRADIPNSRYGTRLQKHVLMYCNRNICFSMRLTNNFIEYSFINISQTHFRLGVTVTILKEKNL